MQKDTSVISLNIKAFLVCSTLRINTYYKMSTSLNLPTA